MPLAGIDIAKAPSIQRIRTVNDLYDITFSAEGLAAVEVPYHLLPSLPLVGAARADSPRLERLMGNIRRQGFRPDQPIICRIGMKGRWVIIDGGHRITAAQIVGGEFWANLFGRPVRSLYFLLFTTPQSWSKLVPRNRNGGLPKPTKKKKKRKKTATTTPGL